MANDDSVEATLITTSAFQHSAHASSCNDSNLEDDDSRFSAN